MTASEPAAQAASQTGSLPPQGQQSQQVANDYIQVPKNDPVLGEFGGRWGEVGKAAKQHRAAEQAGVYTSHAKAVEMAKKYGYDTPDAYLDAVDAFFVKQAADQQQQGQPDVPADPEDRPLTLKQWKELQKQEKEEQQRSQAEASVQEARQREDAEIFKALKEWGIEPPAKGQRDPKFRKALAALDALIYDEKLADFPDHPGMPESVRQSMMRKHLAQAATPDQIARAKAAYQSDQQDTANENVAAFAQKQQGIPSATLGGGAGGRGPAKKPEDMTPTERRAFVKSETARRLQGRPR